MSTYNGTLKKWNATGSVWDILYPKTVADNIISGVLALARIPTLDAGRIPVLDASKITTGVFDVARMPAIALTNTVVSTTMSAYLTIYAADPTQMQEGDVLILTTDNKTYIHNGGSAGTSADFTLLSTPTAAVASVAGKTGVVTLVKGDVGLGSVDNTADAAKNVLSATKLTTPRTIAGVSFDGSANISIPFANLSSKPTTISGYGITDLYTGGTLGKMGADAFNYLEFTGQVVNVYSDNSLVMVINDTGLAHNMKNKRLINVTDPVSAQDAATKNYVDGHQLMLSDALPTTDLIDGQMGFEY